MNTHYIDLPDFPPCFEVLTDRLQTEIRAYARAAIEADRKQQGEVVVTKDEAGYIVAVTRQDKEGRILSVIAEADCKRRGEPVAWLRKNGFRFNAEIEPQDDSELPLYTTPQPAEPVKVNAIFETQDGEAIGTTEARVKRVERQDDGSLTVVIDHWPQPSEPDSAKCAECGAELIPVRPGKWQHPDCSQSPWVAEPVKRKRRYAQGTALGEFGIIPMCDQVDDEPVKVPSDDVLADALANLEHDNYEKSYSGYKNRQADVELIRAALAAMEEQ